jgi:hypothetical protein
MKFKKIFSLLLMKNGFRFVDILLEVVKIQKYVSCGSYFLGIANILKINILFVHNSIRYGLERVREYVNHQLNILSQGPTLRRPENLNLLAFLLSS